MSVVGTIKRINERLKAGQIDDAFVLIQELVNLYPTEWDHFLFSGSVIPEPGSPRFREEARTIIQLLTRLRQTQGEEYEEKAKNIITSLLDLGKIFSTISSGLETLDVWEKPGFAVVYRMAAFLEDQTRLALDKLMLDAKKAQRFSPLDAEDDRFPAVFGGSVSSSTAFEQNVDIFQLITSYALKRYGSQFYGEVGEVRSPYNDYGFTRLTTYASLWLIYKGLWKQLKYLQWTSRVEADSTSNRPRRVYTPIDKEEYIRFEVARIRRQLIMVNYNIQDGSFGNRGANKNIDATLKMKKLARSIDIPNTGKEWNGKINCRILSECIDTELLTEQVLDFHYAPILQELEVGPKGSTIPWKDYWVVRSYSFSKSTSPRNYLQIKPARRSFYAL